MNRRHARHHAQHLFDELAVGIQIAGHHLQQVIGLAGNLVAGQHFRMCLDRFGVPYVESGELVQVLADWTLPVVTAWAVFPRRRLMPARTRGFLDALDEEFSGPRCQQKTAQIEQRQRERRSWAATAWGARL